jgi:hypothetical protein
MRHGMEDPVQRSLQRNMGGAMTEKGDFIIVDDAGRVFDADVANKIKECVPQNASFAFSVPKGPNPFTIYVAENRLVLHVKKEYFDQIKSGEKTEEYRPRTIAFVSFLLDKKPDQVIICSGYPKLTDRNRVLLFPWNGCEEKTIVHKEFGPDPIHVVAIKLSKEKLC